MRLLILLLILAAIFTAIVGVVGNPFAVSYCLGLGLCMLFLIRGAK
jgi:hypothetical protein